MPMSEEMNVVEETVDEVVEVEEATTETPSEEAEATESTPDINTQFLEQFEFQYDKNPTKVYSIDELTELVQKGKALDRYKDKVTTMENDPAYKYIKDYMKSSGYEDSATFVRDIQVNEKVQELVKDGMEEEKAKQYAEQMIPKTEVDTKKKELQSFVDWHSKKVQAGIFDQAIDPDNIPQEVWDAYDKGESLKDAYSDYMIQHIKQNTEQQTLKKVADNGEKAAGKIPEGKPTKTDMTISQVNKLMNSMSSSEQSKWAEENMDMLEKIKYFG